MQTPSLREKVYRYFCQQMANGNLLPGSYINQNEICEQLNVSRAPLRDALIQLEQERFVQIKPRRGVLINPLTVKEIRNAYAVCGALESAVLVDDFDKISPEHVAEMQAINEALYTSLNKRKFDDYYELNLKFHNVFVALADNDLLHSIMLPIKQRLYDFPRMAYDLEWETINLKEHERIMESIIAGNRQAAASILKYEHWGFAVHRDWLVRIYGLDNGSD